MKPDQPQDNKPGKPKFYFGLAFFFLFILALVWSIDSSFIYLLLGITVCCLFFGFRNLIPQNNEADYGQFNKGKQSEMDDADLAAELEKIFTNPSKGNNPKMVNASLPVQRTIRFVIIGIFLIFFAFIFIGVLLGDDQEQAQFYYQQADSFYNNRAYDSASQYYRKAMAINKEYPDALTGYGNVFLMKENYDSAIAMYDKALAIDPEFETALYQKAAAYSYMKNYNRGIAEFKKLLNKNATNFEAMQFIGDNYYEQQKYDSAMIWYEGAYANGLRNRYLCHLLGYIYETKGKTDKAIGLYKEALQYDSAVVDIYERLGSLIPGEEGNWFKTKASQVQGNN